MAASAQTKKPLHRQELPEPDPPAPEPMHPDVEQEGDEETLEEYFQRRRFQMAMAVAFERNPELSGDELEGLAARWETLDKGVSKLQWVLWHWMNRLLEPPAGWVDALIGDYSEDACTHGSEGFLTDCDNEDHVGRACQKRSK